jgi:O-antigen/teichoic acid export membrane protein
MNLPLPRKLTDALPPSAAARGLGGLLQRKGGLHTRILASAAALLVGQGVTVLIQLLSLPLFLHFWSTAQYGKWLMLSAVPAYFAMSDGGMIPVAANKISMLQAAGRTDEANAVFQSALALITLAVAAVGTLAAAVLGLLGDAVLDAGSRLTLWLLIMTTLLSLYGGLLCAGFRAFGSNAQGVLWNELIRSLEFLGMALGLATSGSFVGSAAGFLGGRCAGLLIVATIVRLRFPRLGWSFQYASRSELASLWHPALAYLAFPLGNGLNLQAITLMVGGLFGPVALATFNTYRTISRLVLQLTATLSHAALPEFSRLFGSEDAAGLRRAYSGVLVLAGALSVGTTLAMIVLAPYLLQWWTHGKIGFLAPLFLLFALATLLGGLAHVPRILLMATNRHSALGVRYLLLSGAGVLLAYGLGKLLGQEGTALALCLPESGMFVLGYYYARRLLGGMVQVETHGAV